MAKLQVLLLTGALCVLVQASKWDEKAKIVREKYEEIKSNCSAKQQMSDNELLSYESHDQPETYRERCMLACVLTDAGIMTNGKFNRQGSDDISGFLYEDSPELQMKAREVSRKCEKKVELEKLDDECDTAYEIFLCVRKTSKQMGFKD